MILMRKEFKDSLLQSIANTLSVYAYHIKDAGIATGKARIMLFLYAYARYSKQEYYEDFAGEILDGLLKNARKLPLDFNNGLSGVGWAVNWLLKNNYVDGNPDKVLASVDKDLFLRMSYEKSVLNLSMGIYWAERFSQNSLDENKKKYLHAVLSYLCEGIEKGKSFLTLSDINPILYFWIRMRKQWEMQKEMEILHILRPVMEDIFVRLAYDDVSLCIFQQLYKILGCNIQLSSDRENKLYHKTSLSLEQSIKVSWQEMVYFNKIPLPLPDANSISQFVDRNLQNIQLEKFIINGGLAGLGLGLMNSNSSS